MSDDNEIFRKAMDEYVKRSKGRAQKEYSLIDDKPKIEKLAKLKKESAEATLSTFKQGYGKHDTLIMESLFSGDPEKPLPNDFQIRKRAEALKKESDYIGALRAGGFEDEHFSGNSISSDSIFRRPISTHELEAIEPKIPREMWGTIKKKGLSLVKYGVPIIGTAASAYSALSSDSADAAVGELIGVESLGRDEEQKQLDALYKKRINQKQESLNKLVPTSE